MAERVGAAGRVGVMVLGMVINLGMVIEGVEGAKRTAVTIKMGAAGFEPGAGHTSHHGDGTGPVATVCSYYDEQRSVYRHHGSVAPAYRVAVLLRAT